MSEKNNLFQKLSEKFGNKILEAVVSFGEPVVRVDKRNIHDLLSFLKTDKELSFEMLVDLFGVDYPGAEPRSLPRQVSWKWNGSSARITQSE